MSAGQGGALGKVLRLAKVRAREAEMQALRAAHARAEADRHEREARAALDRLDGGRRQAEGQRLDLGRYELSLHAQAAGVDRLVAATQACHRAQADEREAGQALAGARRFEDRLGERVDALASEAMRARELRDLDRLADLRPVPQESTR